MPSHPVQSRQFTAIIEREGDGFVALCPELDVASQGATIEEARQDLQEAVELFLEAGTPPSPPTVSTPRSTSLTSPWPLNRLHVLFGRQFCEFLRSHGFEEVRHRGSHVVIQGRLEGGPRSPYKSPCSPRFAAEISSRISDSPGCRGASSRRIDHRRPLRLP